MIIPVEQVFYSKAPTFDSFDLRNCLESMVKYLKIGNSIIVTLFSKGSSSYTVVELIPHYLEAVGLIAASLVFFY